MWRAFACAVFSSVWCTAGEPEPEEFAFWIGVPGESRLARVVFSSVWCTAGEPEPEELAF